MTDTERAAALLEPAMLHLRTVQIAIDQLTLLDAKAELHTLTVRLMELAFRAESDSRTVKKPFRLAEEARREHARQRQAALREHLNPPALGPLQDGGLAGRVFLPHQSWGESP
jgi:hypothetical protein